MVFFLFFSVKPREVRLRGTPQHPKGCDIRSVFATGTCAGLPPPLFCVVGQGLGKAPCFAWLQPETSQRGKLGQGSSCWAQGEVLPATGALPGFGGL